jgi:hypothetical protein
MKRANVLFLIIKNMRQNKAYSILYFFLCFGLISCNKEAPNIEQQFTQVNLVKDVEKNIIYQKFSVFVLATDPDGIENIDRIYLINDEKKLYWEAGQSEYAKPLLNNQTWIGLNSISMNDTSMIPKGEYRIILEDFGGETVESSVTIDYKDFDKNKISFPQAVIDKDMLGISRTGSNAFIVWIYDFGGNYVDLIHYTGKRIKASAIAAKNQKTQTGFTFYVYTYDPGLSMGIIAGPYHYSKS